MKSLILGLSTLVYMLSSISAAKAEPTFARLQALSETLESQNWAQLDSLLAENCIYIHSFGRVDRREEFLRNIRRFRSVDEWRYADVELRRYGGVVVATGNLYVTLSLADGSKQISQQRFTEVWVQEMGVEKLASHQSTTFK